MATRYPMPGSPSSASGMCPGSPSSTRSLDDLLICPVCLDEYKDPKTLTCLHSFCYTCLENCKRPYRRDIVCPVCKKVTALTAFGVGALQDDFRIQQIRDIILNRPNSPGTSVEDAVNSPGSEAESKICDLCRTVQKKTSANTHCIQCYMYFCGVCVDKHNNNPLFSSHHVINMAENSVTDTLFCKNHREHPVRYFCKPCSLMMCTICTMDHDPNHAPEPLEKGIINKYRTHLHDSLRVVRSKLTEVTSHSKYLETVKQSHQQCLRDVQTSIMEKTEEVIAKVRVQENHLLKELKCSIEDNMKQHGIGNLSELHFLKDSMDSLCADIQKVIQGSPQDCLLAYDDLLFRMKTLSDAAVPSVSRKRKKHRLKFVPVETDIAAVLGSLQACSLSDTDSGEDELTSRSVSSTSSSYSTLMTTSPKIVTRRVTSILNAISPTRKSEAKKMGKVRSYSTNSSTDKAPKSPTTLNADDLVASSNPDTESCTPELPIVNLPSPGLPTQEERQLGQCRAKMLFKVDQVGGWPGRISSPSSVAFLPDGNLVVTERENRMQVFDKSGHSIRIIGWGKLKPQCVVVNREGHLLVTDKKDRCIKKYDTNGDLVSMWGSGQFSIPSGMGVCSNGNIIISDLEANSIGIYSPDGNQVTRFGSWGSGDYQFNNPSHLTVDCRDNIIVSDSGNSFIKIFDQNGVFLHKFSLQTSKQGLRRQPHGISTDKTGNVIIADHDNHRVSLFSSEGKFLHHIVTKQDGIRHPTGVCLDTENKLLAVVESHAGFLSKDPHHSVKLFQFI